MGLPELRRTAQVVYGANEPSPFRLVFISQTLTENPQNMSPHWREGMFCGFCCGMDMDSLLKCFGICQAAALASPFGRGAPVGGRRGPSQSRLGP